MNIQKLILLILDGWGIGDGSKSDVISSVSTPNISALLKKFPNSKLLTCGENVGLPDGQMGNSEVGHLNIGAGRVIYQDLVKINLAIRDKSINNNPMLKEAYNYAKNNNKKLHLIGLVSDGGVHSSEKHLYHLCDMAKDMGLEKVYIHALTDGRDTDPKSGLGFISGLEKHLKNSAGEIATLCGRYYTMDRDKRWERVKVGYDLLAKGIGTPVKSIVEAVQDSYNNGVTDEFIKPIVRVDDNGNPVGIVENGDVFICFNFRTDRLREITIALTQKDMPEFGMNTLDLKYYTMTRYDDTFKNVNIIFDKDNVKKTLGETISENNLKQLRIAETEKYAHVTFFFSGGREEVFEGESRILIPSPKVATYDLQPEMSAFLVKDAVVAELNKGTHDFICLNFANGDMVGHTGVYSAIQKAVETVDTCVGEVVEAAIKNNYIPIIIADHGNADYAVNTDGSPNTAHSLNPVPCIICTNSIETVKDGILADVAPTILKLMNVRVPEEMTGKPLI
ncbi:MAG: 2,3-bisphosphoglycerate-independent phosphoglycerate mutase [Bacteroidales bacterium]|nr:2,3-bisphosphoglycerate-independent phosphoglycerate mutase [Bacteroidales bacterium]